MSQDSYILLKTECFPHNTWNEILGIFQAEERGASQWVIESPVRLSVREIGRSHVRFGNYRWEIGVHYQGPYDVAKLWVSVAVPYHCLILMEQATYRGPEPHGSPVIDDVVEFRRYAKSFLIAHTSLQKLLKHGYMDDQENLTLDVPRDKSPR